MRNRPDRNTTAGMRHPHGEGTTRVTLAFDAPGAELPDELTDHPDHPALYAVAEALIPPPKSPPTTEMAALRPVPNTRPLAHPDSPVGRTNRRPTPIDPLDGLL